MIIHGKRKIVEDVNVEIVPHEFLNKLFKSCMSKIYKGEGEYINKDGVWEDWYDTGHGSGMTTKHETATQEQIELNAAFNYIIGFIHKHKLR